MNQTGVEALFAMSAYAQTSGPASATRAKIPCTTADYTTSSVSDLIRGCTEADAAAWQEFMRRFNQIIAITAYRAARRWGEGTPGIIDDLTQETYLKLCADRACVLREVDLEHPDSIFGFLKVVTANVANDYFRRLRASKRGGSQANGPFEDAKLIGAASMASAQSMERAVLLDQVDGCLNAVAQAETAKRDRLIFWLYYRQGLTAKQIAGLPSISLSLKGVESTLHRLTQLVRDRLRETGCGKRDKEKGHGKGV
jgi:RNA polymerase sigma-70 factor (ECF subfamily)